MYFEPETTGSAPYIADLARCYANAGYEVHVYTTYPHYPSWRADRSITRSDAYEGVHVHRLNTYVPANPTIARRLAYELIFCMRAIIKVMLMRRLDIIIGCSPNLFSAVMAATASKIRRKPSLQFVQDIVSSALIQTSQSESRTATILLGKIEGWSLRSGVRVIVPTEAFVARLGALGVDVDRVRIIRNWSRLALASDDVGGGSPGLVLHTGNIGQKQSLDLMAPTLRAIGDLEPRANFLFVGDGNRKNELYDSVRDIPRVAVTAPVSSEEYPQLLQSASILLVHERPGVLDMSLPSKLTSYFAAGRPVVAVVHRDSVTAREVRASGAGVVVEHGDTAGLARILRDLFDDDELRARYGRSAHEYCLTHLTREAAFASLRGVLNESKAESS